jgi:outer membrane immunogenic protein
VKKFLLATVALTVLTAPVMAADLPVRPAPVYRAPPPVYVVYSWTGCYVGGHGGGVWINKDYSLTSVGTPWFGVNFPAAVDFGSHDASSWIAGGQVGCNYQVGNVVFGIQGDYAWTDATASHIDPIVALTTLQSTTNALGSVTARIGYAWDRFLGYVKAGGAWESDDYSWFVTAIPGLVTTASETRSGWTVGVGAEYAFTDWFTAFAEYNYYDFGTSSVAFPVGPTFNFDIAETKSVFKVGVNLKWGGAVAARY